MEGGGVHRQADVGVGGGAEMGEGGVISERLQEEGEVRSQVGRSV